MGPDINFKTSTFELNIKI